MYKYHTSFVVVSGKFRIHKLRGFAFLSFPSSAFVFSFSSAIEKPKICCFRSLVPSKVEHRTPYMNQKLEEMIDNSDTNGDTTEKNHPTSSHKPLKKKPRNANSNSGSDQASSTNTSVFRSEERKYKKTNEFTDVLDFTNLEKNSLENGEKIIPFAFEASSKWFEGKRAHSVQGLPGRGEDNRLFWGIYNLRRDCIYSFLQNRDNRIRTNRSSSFALRWN